MKRAIILVLSCLILDANLLLFKAGVKHKVLPPPVAIIRPKHSPLPKAPVEQPAKITFTVPQRDMTFPEIVGQLKEWHKEAPDITEFGFYGKTQHGTEIPYLRIGKKKGPKVLITSSIHGNEHLCAMTTMGVFGTMLDSYMKDDEITKLLRERDVYYVPVISPESFMQNQRHDMGRDPNRNWNGLNLKEIDSIPSIQALKDFHKKEKFKAMMSCHNFGKIYLYPWGFTTRDSVYEPDFRRILGEMSRVTGYRAEQTYRQSAPPYFGYEADWFHKHGAMAIVNEIGTNFVAIPDEVRHEVEVNLKAFKIWIREAPLVRVTPIGTPGV